VNQKYNKSILLTIVLFLVAGTTQADTKVGIGTGISTIFSSSYGGVISVPIKIDDTLMIEPYVGFSFRSEDADTNAPEYNINEREYYQGGFGIYALSNLNKEFEIYYGAALAVGRNNFTYERKYTSDIGTGIITYSYHDETDTLVYMIKPTFGISYLINENFMFSLDAGIYYFWGEETVKTTDISNGTTEYSESNSDVDGADTFTRFVFRMIF